MWVGLSEHKGMVGSMGSCAARASPPGWGQGLWPSTSKCHKNPEPLADLLTLKLNEMVSMEMTDFLAKFCSVPVRKACGKKNPLIQNTEGIPWLIHFCRNSIRCTKSFTQDAKGFSDG